MEYCQEQTALNDKDLEHYQVGAGMPSILFFKCYIHDFQSVIILVAITEPYQELEPRQFVRSFFHQENQLSIIWSMTTPGPILNIIQGRKIISQL